MRRKLELLKLQIKSAFLSIPKIILGTIVTAVLVIAISTCIGIATAQDSDMRMKVAVVYPDYDDTENSDSVDNNKEFRYIKMAFNYVSEIDTIKNVCTFEYTDRQKAIDGLRNNYYVMAIIVPENMISDIMSGENTPVEVVCQSEGVNNTSMIFREMVRAGGSDLATAEAGIYTFDDLFNGVLKNYRGLPSLTAAVVVCVGLLGGILGFKTMKLTHIGSPMAQGLSLGAAAHAVGTSTAMDISRKYGAFASLGLTLNGIFTALLTPTILRLLGLL